MTDAIALEKSVEKRAPGNAPRRGKPVASDIEIELKLEASPAMLQALRGHPALAAGDGQDHTEHLVTTYFDSPGRLLARAGASLRLRQRSHAAQRETAIEQTLKLGGRGGGVLERSEWTVTLPGDAPHAPVAGAFPPRARSALGNILGQADLAGMAQVRVERHVRNLRRGDALIELAFDTGAITADGAAPTTVCELELELRQGRLADVLELALELPLGPDLHWSIATKAQRAQALSAGQERKGKPPVTTCVPPLARGHSIAQGLHAIGWACLGQLLANYPQVVAHGDAGALHQSRVAMRRLRTAMGLFNRVLLTGDTQANPLRAQWREMASGLGRARDLHVLRRDLLASDAAKRAAGPRLLDHLARAEAEATVDAQALLASSAFQMLLLRQALWLETGAWRQGGLTQGPALAEFAGALFARRRRPFKGMRRQVATLPPEALHDLRIEVKKLRYAVGFLMPVCPPAQAPVAREYEEVLTDLQDVLGDLHDDDLRHDPAATDALHGPLDHRLQRRLAQAMTALSGKDGREARLARTRALLAREKELAGWWEAE